MAQMITVIRSRSPSTALEQEEQDQGGGAQARQHEFQFQPILQDPPPAAWDREQDGEERYLNSGMKSSHRSRHPTGQLESRPAARSGSWGGVDESDDDINHLSGIRNGPEFAMNVDPPLSSSPLPAVNFGAGAAPLNVIAADADLNPADVDGDRRSPEAGVVSPEEEEKFRKRLAFFFMDPVQKYKAKKNIPWKLTFQIVKVVLVTVQLCIFGNFRYAHTKYYTDNQIAFEHLFLKDWDAVREIHAYPPATGAYAIYKKEQFFGYFDHIAETYVNIQNLTVNPVFRNSSFSFCKSEFSTGQVFPNLTWTIDLDNTEDITECMNIPYEDLADENFKSLDYLASKNSSIKWDTLKWAQIDFSLKTLTFTQLGSLLGPECFSFPVMIHFDNADYDGQIPVNLHIKPHREKCPNQVDLVTNVTTVSIRLLNYVVLSVCVASLALCIRALIRAQLLRRRAERVFRIKYGWKLTSSEKMDFLNVWYIMICINDILIITGSLIKELIETRNTYTDLWDYCSIFLGTGTMLVWTGMLRYLGFFEAYNILILTLKGALPKVFRFLFVVIMIYFGFTFAGWVILGPYHFKFKTLLSTSECLFSLVNGDDMFATFNSTPDTSKLVYYYARVYLYTFISMFIYVILSLFIALIMDSYEFIKKCYEEGWPKQRMHEYYKVRNYDPLSGIFREPRGDGSSGLKSFLSNLLTPSSSRSRPDPANNDAVTQNGVGSRSSRNESISEADHPVDSSNDRVALLAGGGNGRSARA